MRATLAVVVVVAVVVFVVVMVRGVVLMVVMGPQLLWLRARARAHRLIVRIGGARGGAMAQAALTALKEVFFLLFICGLNCGWRASLALGGCRVGCGLRSRCQMRATLAGWDAGYGRVCECHRA